ncbi:LysR family transcriptional regulator [Parvularcula sp. IMCC14364]|uniref:LysR family transcriptional regulator n=1 Tax=Parvularcula sp. IMCC14364 TaxID=3067902 RepID=UPI00274031E2|nr:LysR family transcriptional regulator [Parvularcula sp. IMCC14364]
MGQLEEMSVFVEIARAEGITGAAERLNLAPSAVSRRLKDLEARLGTQLVSRTTRHVSLTDAGRTYLAHAERILSDVDEANSDIAQLRSTLAGKIYLAAPLSFGLRHLPDALSTFMKANPEISVEVDMSDRMIDLAAEGFNLALRIGNLEDSSLMARKIAELPAWLAASPDFIEKHGPFKTLEDLHGLPALIYTGGTGKAETINVRTEKKKEDRIPVEPVCLSNNGDLLASLAEHGHGIIRSPCFILQNAVDGGKLVRLFESCDWGTVTLQAVWPPTRHLTARTRALIDFFAMQYANLPPE